MKKRILLGLTTIFTISVNAYDSNDCDLADTTPGGDKAYYEKLGYGDTYSYYMNKIGVTLTNKIKAQELLTLLAMIPSGFCDEELQLLETLAKNTSLELEELVTLQKVLDVFDVSLSFLPLLKENPQFMASLDDAYMIDGDDIYELVLNHTVVTIGYLQLKAPLLIKKIKDALIATINSPEYEQLQKHILSKTHNDFLRLTSKKLETFFKGEALSLAQEKLSTINPAYIIDRTKAFIDKNHAIANITLLFDTLEYFVEGKNIDKIKEYYDTDPSVLHYAECNYNLQHDIKAKLLKIEFQFEGKSYNELIDTIDDKIKQWNEETEIIMDQFFEGYALLLQKVLSKYKEFLPPAV